MTTRVVVGLGANLGDRVASIRAATARIGQLAHVDACSSLWETSPVGGPPQPDFVNAAVLFSREPPWLPLLEELLAIEHDLGRVRGVVDGPRVIDLDLLWIEGTVLDEPRLVVPHPRLHLRAFALAPLLEVAPDAIDPRSGQPFTLALADPAQRVRRLPDILRFR